MIVERSDVEAVIELAEITGLTSSSVRTRSPIMTSISCVPLVNATHPPKPNGVGACRWRIVTVRSFLGMLILRTPSLKSPRVRRRREPLCNRLASPAPPRVRARRVPPSRRNRMPPATGSSSPRESSFQADLKVGATSAVPCVLATGVNVEPKSYVAFSRMPAGRSDLPFSSTVTDRWGSGLRTQSVFSGPLDAIARHPTRNWRHDGPSRRLALYSRSLREPRPTRHWCG